MEMINFLRISTKIIFVIILSFSKIYAQNEHSTTNPFASSVVFSLDAGITYPQTDYQIVKLGLSGRMSIEYYLNTHTIHLPGFKLKIGYDQLAGKDTRGTIPSQDGIREIPPTFSTNIFSVGLAATYCISINDAVFPYISGGISNLWFDPKDDQGNPAEYNAAGNYEKSTIAYTLEIGLKVKVSDKVSLDFSANPYFPKTDYLDDVAAAYTNDSHTTIMAGITFTPFYSSDWDGDGIINDNDLCPDEAEDFDGYQDEDGCPDVDNDGDGILDVNDKCPNEAEDYDAYQDEDGCPDVDNDGDGIPDVKDKCPNKAEDYDGYQDEDGCPDVDNDGDGILDVNDKCPNEAEDIDGYQDEDGCPDIDNDGDGILDVKDKCPNEAEDFEGYEDEDGCPDGGAKISAEKFTLPADEIFSPNSSLIKVEGKKSLDEVVMQLKKFPDKKWRIEGYMDSNGGVRFLRSLSLDRAKAVLEYFTEFGGLKRENFQVFGLGENSPIADNNTEEGRSKNRRIEIVPAE